MQQAMSMMGGAGGAGGMPGMPGAAGGMPGMPGLGGMGGMDPAMMQAMMGGGAGAGAGAAGARPRDRGLRARLRPAGAPHAGRARVSRRHHELRSPAEDVPGAVPHQQRGPLYPSVPRRECGGAPTGDWLVGDEHLWVVHQSHGNHYALAHST